MVENQDIEIDFNNLQTTDLDQKDIEIQIL